MLRIAPHTVYVYLFISISITNINIIVNRLCLVLNDLVCGVSLNNLSEYLFILKISTVVFFF